MNNYLPWVIDKKILISLAKDERKKDAEDIKTLKSILLHMYVAYTVKNIVILLLVVHFYFPLFI